MYYFIEPISFQPVLGIPGTYMAFLSGNISNLRVPCSSVAQKAAGVEEGTPQGAVVSTIGVAVSIVVNLAILTLGVILGAQIISLIPASLVSALVYLVPALYGAMLMQMILYSPKIALIAVPLGCPQPGHQQDRPLRQLHGHPYQRIRFHHYRSSFDEDGVAR